MTSPYDGLGPEAFWRSAVAEGNPGRDRQLYRPKFQITQKTRIFTAGSCFAQQVTHGLRVAGCDVIDTEPLDIALQPHVSRRFGYGIYSARFGNIYTFRQFRQLVAEVLGLHTPSAAIWKRGDAYFDALRPTVEPEGFGSKAALLESRAAHLAATRRGLQQADVLIFTPGLTECWEHRESGTVYPTAPETLAGAYDPVTFAFRNLGYEDCIDDFVELRGLLTELNPKMRIILTVSPVPLTATASGQHVLSASNYSKSVLRAVCGALSAADPAIDYYPSYELITTQHAKGHWFDENLRTPSPDGIAMVTEHFLRAHGLETAPDCNNRTGSTPDPLSDEILLEAFLK